MQDLWQPIQFDRAMLRKYDRPGPRYTSYPTAPHFEDGFRHADYVQLLERSAGTDRPLSLYVHIPFCAHRCFFCGCNVTISHDRTWGRRYLPLLGREMEIVAERLAAHRREVVQIHWGGGTPTFLPPEDLAELMALIWRNFRLSKDCEIGVEVDPRECSPAHLDVLAEVGVNRLSMGLQELDPEVQKAVNRVQTPEQTWAILEGAR
jgi:oxygen-independent coproporphyrinogen-3 oxidase